VHRKIGPAWTGRGRPPAGFYTRRLAQEWLDAVLVRARAGTLPGAVRTGASFDDACAEYLRFLEHDRQRKPSTIRDAGSIVRNHLLPAFGGRRLDVSAELVERWARELGCDRPQSNRSKQKIIVVFHGLMERARRVWKLDADPVRDVDRPRTAAAARGVDVFSPDEVFALVRHADDEQDGALFLLAAFTGLRQGELIALRWRDVDFPGEHVRVTASYTTRALTSPKSGRVRSVPLAPAAASALARLSQREHRTGDDDLVFPGITGTYLDASALLKRYKRALRAAGLRPLRFHDLRHTFGTTMIRKADIVRVRTWMGHADIETTRKYLHFAPRPDDARLVAEAFAGDRAPVDFPQHRSTVEKQASEEGR
jgi:integrase